MKKKKIYILFLFIFSSFNLLNASYLDKELQPKDPKVKAAMKINKFILSKDFDKIMSKSIIKKNSELPKLISENLKLVKIKFVPFKKTFYYYYNVKNYDKEKNIRENVTYQLCNSLFSKKIIKNGYSYVYEYNISKKIKKTKKEKNKNIEKEKNKNKNIEKIKLNILVNKKNCLKY